MGWRVKRFEARDKQGVLRMWVERGDCGLDHAARCTQGVVVWYAQDVVVWCCCREGE